MTNNLKDLPTDVLAAHAVEARHPDDFLVDQLDLYPSRTLAVLVRQAQDLVRPPVDLAGLLNRLERCGVAGFVESVRRGDHGGPLPAGGTAAGAAEHAAALGLTAVSLLPRQARTVITGVDTDTEGSRGGCRAAE